MAISWITPKEDWANNYIPIPSDFNRIEGNTSFIANSPASNLLRLSPNNGNVLLGTDTNKTAFLQITKQESAAPPALGIDGGSLSLFGSISTFGMLHGILTTGDGWIQQQRVDTVATPYNLLLQPNGGNLLVRKSVSSGEGFQVGSGGMKISGSTGSFAVDAAGLTLAMTAPTTNFLYASSDSGSFVITTNGRPLTLSDSNVHFATDKSSNFYGDINSLANVNVSGAINPTITPTKITTPTLSTDGATYVIPNGTYDTINVVLKVLSETVIPSVCSLQRKNSITGAWGNVRITSYVPLGTYVESHFGTIMSNGDNYRIRLDETTGGEAQGYAVLDKF